MKVKDVMTSLSALDGEEEIAISWWDKECVEDSLGKVTAEAWSWLTSNWETNSDELFYVLEEYHITTGQDWKVQS